MGSFSRRLLQSPEQAARYHSGSNVTLFASAATSALFSGRDYLMVSDPPDKPPLSITGLPTPRPAPRFRASP